MKSKAVQRFLICSCILSTAIVLCIHGYRLLTAEVLLADSRQLLQFKARDIALEKAMYAVSLFPQSDDYTRAQFNSAFLNGELDQALDSARRLILIAPADARSWLSLAYAKAKAGQIDSELKTALARACEYARYYDAVQLSISRLAVLLWDELDMDTREWLGQSLTYILAHQFRYRFIAFLFAHEQESVICPAYANTQELRGWCKRTTKLRDICSHRNGNPELMQWCAKRGIGKGS